jgi:hypothetical protein
MSVKGYLDSSNNTILIRKNINNTYSSTFDLTGVAPANISTGYRIDGVDIGSTLPLSYGIYNDLTISCIYKIKGEKVNNIFLSFNKLPPLFQYASIDPQSIKVVDSIYGYRILYFYRSRLADKTSDSFGRTIYTFGNLTVKAPHPVYMYSMVTGGGGSGGHAPAHSWAAAAGGGAGAFISSNIPAYGDFAFCIKSIGKGGNAIGGGSTGNYGESTEIQYGQVPTPGVLINYLPSSPSNVIAGGGGGGGGASGYNGGANFSTGAKGSCGGAVNGGGSYQTYTAAAATVPGSNRNDFSGTTYVNTGGSSTSGWFGGNPVFSACGAGGGGAGAQGGAPSDSNTVGGDGGAGIAWWPNNIKYAGGGGGSTTTNFGDVWGKRHGYGSDGGGNGGYQATPGAANTGSGGGAGYHVWGSGSGGTGIVGLAIALSNFKQPNTLYHLRFNYLANNTALTYASYYTSTSDIYCSTRTFNWNRESTAAAILIVGGGGGGSGGEGYEGGGGGGGGGVVTGYIPLIQNVTYTITVGTGGTGSAANSHSGTRGSNSSITWTYGGSNNSITAYGGGGGSVPRNGRVYYKDGGSGGGSGAGGYDFNSGIATRGTASGDIATRKCLAFWGNEGEYKHAFGNGIGGGGGGGALQRAWTPSRDAYLGWWYTGHDGGKGLTWLDGAVYGSGGGGGVGVIPSYGAYYFGGLGGTNAGSGAGQSDRNRVVGHGDGTLPYNPARLYSDAQMTGTNNYGGGGGGGNGLAQGSLSLRNGGNGGSGRVIIAPIDYKSNTTLYWDVNSPWQSQ